MFLMVPFPESNCNEKKTSALHHRDNCNYPVENNYPDIKEDNGADMPDSRIRTSEKRPEVQDIHVRASVSPVVTQHPVCPVTAVVRREGKSRPVVFPA